MKKIIVLITIATILLTSCSVFRKKTDEEKARATIEAFLKKNLNDPSSYRFVSNEKYGDIDIDAAILNATLKEERAYDEAYYSRNDPDDMGYSKIDMKYHKRLINILDSIKKATPNSTHIISTMYDLEYRAKNKMGALVLDKLRYQVDGSFKLQYIVTDDSLINFLPDSIPDYTRLRLIEAIKHTDETQALNDYWGKHNKL